MIASYSGMVQARMKGEMRSGLISPVVAIGASKAFDLIEKKLIDKFATPKLNKQLAQEWSKKGLISGVSAGDGLDDLELELELEDDIDDELNFKEETNIKGKLGAKTSSQFDLSKPFTPYISGRYYSFKVTYN
jgi:hypothetical protein